MTYINTSNRSNATAIYIRVQHRNFGRSQSSPSVTIRHLMKLFALVAPHNLQYSTLQSLNNGQIYVHLSQSPPPTTPPPPPHTHTHTLTPCAVNDVSSRFPASPVFVLVLATCVSSKVQQALDRARAARCCKWGLSAARLAPSQTGLNCNSTPCRCERW